jgi:hypothetical protein
MHGSHVRLEAVLPSDYEIEVMYVPEGISVWAETTWGTRAFRDDGTELAL